MSPVRRNRRGNASVVALSLTALLGFGSLAVDVAVQRVTDAQIQAAAESAVLAGAGYLDRTGAGLHTARAKAVEFANLNAVTGWTLTEAEVQIGIYEDGTFTEVDITDLTAEDPIVRRINAVRVATTHSASPVLSSILGNDSLDTENVAMAVREVDRGSARSVPCVLPLAIPDCGYRGYLDGTNTSGVNPAGFRFQMTNSNNDNIGWANQFTTNYGSDDIVQALSGGGCSENDLEVGEEVYVKNGQNTSVLHFLEDVFNGDHAQVAPDTWDPNIADRPARDGVSANCPPGAELDGGSCRPQGGNPNIGSGITDANWSSLEPVIQGPVALIRPTDCSDIQFTNWHEVSGFAWAMIYDVENSGSDKNIWVQLDFVNEHDFGGDIDEEGNGNITGLDKPKLVF